MRLSGRVDSRQTIRDSPALEWDRAVRPATTKTSVTTLPHVGRQAPWRLPRAMPPRLLLLLVAVRDDRAATAAALTEADAAGSDRLPSAGRYRRLQIRDLH